jgi:hypothetical protein
MKIRALPLLCSLAVASVCSTAHATLIGDTITVAKVDTILNQPFVTTVQAGPGDIVSFSFLDVNPEASSIGITNSVFPLILEGPGFHGFVISDIDATIIGASVSTNLAGWDPSRLAFDAHSVSANLADLTFLTTTAFTINLSFGRINPTPDAAPTAALLGLALAGLLGLRRKLGVASH